MDLPAKKLSPDDALSKLLPAPVAVPLAGLEILTVEDLYDMVASLGAGWFREVEGLDAQGAAAIVSWLASFGRDVGEVTERFYPAGFAPEADRTDDSDYGIVPLERLALTPRELGEGALNRAPAVGCSLEARDDLEALKQWLVARAPNPNTRGNYRKEAERYLLWCVRERGTALSAVRAGDAALYLRWLESLGRTDESEWAQTWKIPQAAWIAPKNTPRKSPRWRPFNGPLSVMSRRNAVTVVRQLYNFLKKTGYLIFNPFDQVSGKVPLLRGEGAPQAFGDRSLTEAQWEDVVRHINMLPEGYPRERMRAILMLGKTLGLRSSEIIDARVSWIVTRRMGFRERAAIEVVGKGSKVRRLPLTSEQLGILDGCLKARGLGGLQAVPPETPLLTNLGRGGKPFEGLTRGGLYRIVAGFFESVAMDLETSRPLDAARLRAASTHWLRHSFAIEALTKMNVNIVQAAMGHASVSTTGRYLAPEEEEMSDALARMSRF